MKLEQYKDKKAEKKKILTISIGVVLLISVSLLLYKTFAIFKETATFSFMSGQVDYFGNSDVYFLFYKGNEMLTSMPQKGNEENLVFERGECDKGASIEWDAERWAPLVKDLNQTKTECKIYFKEQKDIVLGKDILPIESGDGLYAVTHDDLEELGQEWNKTEYRYAGADPDNYVSFNNEIWRIIGLVNVKVGDSVEQRVKIVRTDGVKDQKDFGNYAWDRSGSGYATNWTTSKLKDMLNGIYYESSTGECYTGSNGNKASQNTCDFTGNGDEPKGLDDTAREMIDKEVIWNIGIFSDSERTVKKFYEKERGTSIVDGNTYQNEWSIETDEGGKHNGIGLIYPSDFGYAVGGEVRNNCLTKNLYDYNGGNCNTNDWLKPNNNLWSLSLASHDIAFVVFSSGFVYDDYSPTLAEGIWPAGYLTSSTKIIDGTGDIDSPFILSQN